MYQLYLFSDSELGLWCNRWVFWLINCHSHSQDNKIFQLRTIDRSIFKIFLLFKFYFCNTKMEDNSRFTCSAKGSVGHRTRRENAKLTSVMLDIWPP